MDKYGIFRLEDNGVEVPLAETFKTYRLAKDKVDELAMFGNHKFRIVPIEVYRESMRS